MLVCLDTFGLIYVELACGRVTTSVGFSVLSCVICWLFPLGGFSCCCCSGDDVCLLPGFVFLFGYLAGWCLRWFATFILILVLCYFAILYCCWSYGLRVCTVVMRSICVL